MDRSDFPEYSGHKIDVGTFWGSVGNVHDASGSLRFPTVGKITKSLLSIPHSNADAERISC